MNDLFISIDYNARQLDGIKEFEGEIQQEYLSQIRPIWIPACSNGAEFWITIFINSEITDFLKSAVIGGLTWDFIKVKGKKYILSPLYKALEKLNEENEKRWGGLKVLQYKLQFDDCEILVGGLNSNFTSIFTTVFNEVAKRKPEFENEVGQKVITIELPIHFIEHLELNQQFSIDSENENVNIDAFKKLWRVTFSTEWPVLMYCFVEKKMFSIEEMSKRLSANKDTTEVKLLVPVKEERDASVWIKIKKYLFRK